MFIDEIDIPFNVAINDNDPERSGDVSCHDPDDVSPLQPITSTPKAKAPSAKHNAPKKATTTIKCHQCNECTQ